MYMPSSRVGYFSRRVKHINQFEAEMFKLKVNLVDKFNDVDKTSTSTDGYITQSQLGGNESCATTIDGGSVDPEFCQLNLSHDTILYDAELDQYCNQFLDQIVECGDLDCDYPYCGAKLWRAEGLLKYDDSMRPIFSLCCSRGKVQLPYFKDPSDVLQKLFLDSDCEDSKNILESIRSYNNCSAFTSMGGRVDRTINNGRGRYVFRVLRENHHRIDSLLPADGDGAKFAQLYIYDTNHCR